ncbi:hypothetical protein [Phytoactinopolyspora limicola]|uniref:hypothetical protein n=1 Tax=Phytoactinopolyspora limicola TaxID=2715536 RepID=UPI001A9C6468|nr:hypothetical protein [Phytoactinopolyspora limicola]
MRSDAQVLVCPECQESHGWSSDVDHCPTCNGTNLVRRLGQTVCRACESSATAEFLAVESTTDRGVAVGAAGRHRRPDDGRDLTAEVASALDRVLGKHARREPTDGPPDTDHIPGPQRDGAAPGPSGQLPGPAGAGPQRGPVQPGPGAGGAGQAPGAGGAAGEGRGRSAAEPRGRGSRLRRGRRR